MRSLSRNVITVGGCAWFLCVGGGKPSRPTLAIASPDSGSPGAQTPIAEALDVEKLAVVRTFIDRRQLVPVASTAPSADVPVRKLVTNGPGRILSCDVLVVGGGTGGVAAAEALARNKATVILTEPTSQVGGQFSAQAVSCPDETDLIESSPGFGTRSYRELRAAIRARYAAMPGILAGRAQNVGDCWVSRISAEPLRWQEVILARLRHPQVAGGVKSILLRHQLVRVGRTSAGRFDYADFVDLDKGAITRVKAKYMLDATENGEGLIYAGCKTVIGAEPRSAWQEEPAPDQAHPEWIQSFTYGFAVRYAATGSRNLVPRPAEYDYFKSLGQYTLDLSGGDTIAVYKVFAPTKFTNKVTGKTVPARSFWSYRRLVAGESFRGKKSPNDDVALINWKGNDFHEETLAGKSLADQVRVLRRGKQFALGFLYWLQNECARDDGKGKGYPEIQLAKDVMGSADGLSLVPYIRESHRLVVERPVTANDMILRSGKWSDLKGSNRWGREFADTVGIGHYSAMDIHEAKGEPFRWSLIKPYHIPLSAFIAKSGPPNVLPAAKNIGGTRLAMAAVRMHPTEWACGEVAGHLAAYCLRKSVDPAAVRANPALLQAFQQQLVSAGVPIRWRDIIPRLPERHLAPVESDLIMSEYNVHVRE